MVEEFTERGFRVLCVPEAATILISCGVTNQTCGSSFQFQKHLLRMQMELERIFYQAAQAMQCDNVLLICDRGFMDGKAYLTNEEFSRILMDADPSRHPIRKTRYCFLYDNRYFELDVYPFWDDRAIFELELSSEEEEVSLPKELELIWEVTDDDAYKNASLAKNG